MRLSILSAMRETFALWLRHWRFFVFLAALIRLADLLSFPTYHRQKGQPLQLDVGQPLVSLVVLIVTQGAGMAAFLSLVARPSGERPWVIIVRGIRRYTGRIVVVQLLLALLAFLLMIPVGLLLVGLRSVFGFSGSWIFFQLVFLLFLKYALADPLIVAEERGATESLRVSWRMTRNRFGFVLGCYLLFGLPEHLLGDGLYRLGVAVDSLWNIHASPGIAFVREYIATFWYALPWIMYLQIKAAGDPRIEPPDPDVFRSTRVAPEGA